MLTIPCVVPKKQKIHCNITKVLRKTYVLHEKNKSVFLLYTTYVCDSPAAMSDIYMLLKLFMKADNLKYYL
jgi:hypothetical protein